MKYTLKALVYPLGASCFEYAYISDEDYTDKLSEATIWDTIEDVVAYKGALELDDHKIVRIKDKEYFQAKLAGT